MVDGLLGRPGPVGGYGVARLVCPANGPASALAADLSGDPWRDYRAPVLIYGRHLDDAGEEHDVDLTAGEIADLRRRLGRRRAN
ncbi:hypothetical protein [Herbidospora sp. NBRC 101105]|uniref:hypothetical protein n=1 Tax=Herbidospora sp. NBRC 101105 TaxID=3032195 RepID=UPI0024A5D3C0|nr:hypothetical protein [Herbidospora sp. NBRC 101105]GLX98556.1 hypothetical protein Hesp01_65060 [Herbidospora sp. NBRC 101105]